MIYYELQSPYAGDTTKHCDLTVDEMDSNFFELEDSYHKLCRRVSDV